MNLSRIPVARKTKNSLQFVIAKCILSMTGGEMLVLSSQQKNRMVPFDRWNFWFFFRLGVLYGKFYCQCSELGVVRY